MFECMYASSQFYKQPLNGFKLNLYTTIKDQQGRFKAKNIHPVVHYVFIYLHGCVK